MNHSPAKVISSGDENTMELQEPWRDTSSPRTKSVCISPAFRGLLLSLLSGVIYSLTAVLVKYLADIHPTQLAMYRFFGILSLSLPQAIKREENLFGPRKLRILLILRGISGATNLTLNFIAFRYLPLGEAAVIICSFPVFVTIFARLFLKESCGVVQSITVITTIIGIIFIMKIPETITGMSVAYTKEQIYGLSSAIVSVFFSSSLMILSRKVKSMHHSVIMFNFGWVASLETSIIAATVGDFSLYKCGFQQGLLAFIGILSYFEVILLTMALQQEQAGPVSTMRAASSIILAFLWQTFLFQDSPDGLSLTGAFLVGLSVVLLGLRKWASTLHQDSPAAKYLKFLLV